jgi:hypothetical protein
MIQTETPYPWYPLFEEARENAFTYEAFDAMMKEHSETGKTTGHNQSEALLEYSRLNYRRMKRWHKTLQLPLEVEISLSHLERPVTWLVITEGWCGDAAHVLPVLNAMARQQPLIDLRVVLRDENPELMDQFLYNGTRSIPIVISLSMEDHRFMGTWGPRPAVLSQRVIDEKAAKGTLSPEFKQELQAWYNTNKGQDIARELLKLLPLE